MSALGLVSDVVDADVRARAVNLAREHGVRLPTFAEIAAPWTAPEGIRERLAGVDPDASDPANLFRIHWYNDAARTGTVDVPLHVELPKSLTGVDARIVVAFGYPFPMIGAHKVLPAYACLAPRLVSGLFDPTTQRAIWPSTGNYCRGGVAVSSILNCRGVAVLPEGMSQERFDWLDRWVIAPEDVVRTPGTESNVKEIYDKCAELDEDPANIIVNQFNEFGNYLCHFHATGSAFAAIFDSLYDENPNLRLAAYVAASGSSGTLAAGDYLKDAYGSKTAVVEAVECPTLLRNGYGEHNIQGIGDKHVPYIHNVMNTDVVIGVSDKATDGLDAVFNSDVGRAVLTAKGVDDATLDALGNMGLSSICNVLASIKLAKELDLGPDEVILTVATDGAAMYGSERADFVAGQPGGELTTGTASELVARHLYGADTEDVLEATHEVRERIFNLGYFTWVEQQGVPLADFDARKDQSFWRSLHGYIPIWDEMIESFNRDSGLG